MLLENIDLGKTIEIFVDREEYRYHFVSKVEDTNEFRVCVTAIVSNGKFFNFLPTDRVWIMYRDRNTRWEWDNVKPGIAKLEGSPVHYFQIVDKGKSFNRRKAYRVKLLEKALLKYYEIPGQPEKYFDIPLPPVDRITEEEEKEWLKKVSDPKSEKGLIRDVSENGAGIYCDANFKVEDEIVFDIPSAYGNLEVKAVIVRAIKIQSADRPYKYYYGCTFVKTDRRLLRFIFDLQRESLKRQKDKEEDSKG